ncbi:hypothetical protein [Desulfopila inferna]|uniref:hypothetical protein n=1 Tax=Desulfopila inferna TaxID=468528 RepID=UPI001965DC1A|nr:hypothetical protein [Desulfopila inferna]MBM9604700.1 hypothetical protein [Desulfopila inferna]
MKNVIKESVGIIAYLRLQLKLNMTGIVVHQIEVLLRHRTVITKYGVNHQGLSKDDDIKFSAPAAQDF